MEIAEQRNNFCGAFRQFAEKIAQHEQSVDPQRWKDINRMAEKLQSCDLGTADVLTAKVIDDFDFASNAMETLLTYARGISIPAIATRGNLSDTGRMTLAGYQRDAITKGETLMSTIRDAISTLVHMSSLPLYDVEKILLSATNERDFGRMTVKIAKKYLPLLPANTREQIVKKLSELTGAILGAKTIPDRRGLCMTNGSLIAVSDCLPVEELTKLFGYAWDETISIEANLSALGKQTESAVVMFATYRPSDKIIYEFDSRGVFDAEYIAKEGLAVKPQSGLNARMIKRFTTIKEHANSGATDDADADADASASASRYPRMFRTHEDTKHVNRMIVIEVVTPLLCRILASPRFDPPLYSDPAQVGYLIDGNTTRAAEYNARINDAIMARAFDERVMSVVNMYKAFKPDPVIAAGMRNDIEKWIIEHLQYLIKEHKTDTTIKHAYIACEDAYFKNMPPALQARGHRSAKRTITSQAFVRLRNLAYRAAKALNELPDIASLDYHEIKKVAYKIAENLHGSGLLDVFNEELNEFYLRITGSQI